MIINVSHTTHAKVIRATLTRAAKHLHCVKNTAISVILVGDSKIRQLNRKYRGKDKTTNVLAFATGDILISLPEAKREAKKYGWTLQYEVARLALHGFLHLLGYDHIKDKEAKVMEKIEQKILRSMR